MPLPMHVAVVRAASRTITISAFSPLQPTIQALPIKYGRDKAELSKAISKLYRDENVHPFKGCVPLALQAPLFVGLIWVIMSSAELQGAPFFLWMTDVGAPDPLFILPVIVCGFIMLLQKLSAGSADRGATFMMYLVALLMLSFFAFLPVSVNLFILTNICFGIWQQAMGNRAFRNETRSIA